MAKFTKQDILRRTGNISQIAYARSCTLLQGRGGGCQTIEVVNSGGLEFTVLQDKCLDIFDLRYKGINLSFVAKAGLTAPQYYNPHGEFPHYFQGGMLATCGLRNAGAGGADEGEEHALHGRIGNTPAENVGVVCGWQADEYLITISGDMREAAIFKENLLLHRIIGTSLGSHCINITDRVDNNTCKPEALMLLYHINFGYPFLSPSLHLMLPKGAKTYPRDAEAEKGMDYFRKFESPVDDYKEQCFYHEMPSLTDGDTCAVLRNDELDLAVYVKYNTKQLPVLTQWKCMASGDYALGIEPGTCHVEGRAKERRMGSLKLLEPFGSACINLEIGVLEGREIDVFIEEYNLTLG